MKKKILVVASIALLAVLTTILTVNAVIRTVPTEAVVSEARPTPSATAPTPRVTPTVEPAKAAILTVSADAEMAWAATLEPSDFTRVFQLVDEAHGYYASGGTTYLITHSYAKGYGAPGNAWETLAVGDIVSFDGTMYEVNRVSTPGKGSIASEPVWANDPNMLVMITCLSRGDGTSATNNFVIRLNRL